MYPAIQATSVTLMEYVRTRLASDPVLASFFDPGSGGTMVVSINNPAEMADANEEGVSLWLYRVLRDPNRLNLPPVRLGPWQIRQPSLPLRLHYLVTPFVRASQTNSADLEQRVLGKIMQGFHDHARFRGADLEGDLAGSTQEFQVALETLTIEDLARIWAALNRPYQLSISYEVSVLNIDSELVESIAPVHVAEPVSGVIVNGGAE